MDCPQAGPALHESALEKTPPNVRFSGVNLGSGLKVVSHTQAPRLITCRTTVLITGEKEGRSNRFPFRHWGAVTREPWHPY